MTFLRKICNFIRDKIGSACDEVESEIDEPVAELLEEQPRERVRDADRDVNYLNEDRNRNSLHSAYFNVCQIFTDGSMQANGKSGSCFVLHNLTTGHIVYKTYRLDNQTSCCVTEYAAIYQALNFLISNQVERSYIELYTDVELAPFHLSEACDKQVLGKKKSRINLTIFKEKIRALRSKQNVIEFRWIRRCTVLLNRYADLFAKQGSHLKEINFDASIIQV